MNTLLLIIILPICIPCWLIGYLTKVVVNSFAAGFNQVKRMELK